MIVFLGLAGLTSGAALSVTGALWVRGYTGRHLGTLAIPAGLALGLCGAAVALLSLDVITSGDASEAARSLALPEQVYRGAGLAWVVGGVILAWRGRSYLDHVTREDPDVFQEGLLSHTSRRVRSVLVLVLALGMVLGGAALLL